MKIVNVLGYEGLYAVTDEGDIYSLKRGEVMKQRINNAGYFEIVLCKCGIKKTYRVHQVVYNSFHGKEYDDLVIDHINSIKTDNRLDNLRKITNRENSSRSKTNRYGRGVRYFKRIKRFGAEISISKTRYYLGTFQTQEEAKNAYEKALLDWEDKGILPFKTDRSVKLCKGCGNMLPKSDFYYIKGHGTTYLCKECHKKQMNERRNTFIKNNSKKRVL